MSCAQSATERAVIEQFNSESSLKELSHRFLTYLRNARQSRKFGLRDEIALDEFERAFSALPKEYRSNFDDEAFDAARNEVDPVFWTACLSGSTALKMERSNAENPQDPPAELEGEGRR